MALILVGGGSRSGKSSYALQLASDRGPRRAFIATAQAFDDEMRERIAQHQAERDPGFLTIEEPFELARQIAVRGPDFDAIVIDCLTLWLSNLLLAETSGIPSRCDEMIAAASASPAQCILVTNEVGCGIVPENALARAFRDLAGRLNQRAAQASCEAYWMAFGIPIRLK